MGSHQSTSIKMRRDQQPTLRQKQKKGPKHQGNTKRKSKLSIA